MLFWFVLLLMACSEGQKLQYKNGLAVIPEARPGERVATYAGGCFWSMQECMIELKGVRQAISGYAEHAEAVQVYYDPEVISFEQLTSAFFHAHDPTQVDRQGPDIGSNYRSIAFFRSPEEYRSITKQMKSIAASGRYSNPVATEVLPYQSISGAEMEHQDYYKNNSWDTYIRKVSKPKVMKLRKELPLLIKKEYLNRK